MDSRTTIRLSLPTISLYYLDEYCRNLCWSNNIPSRGGNSVVLHLNSLWGDVWDFFGK